MSLRDDLPEIEALSGLELLQSEAPDEAVALFDGEVQAAVDRTDAVISIYGEIGRNPFSDIDNSEKRISAALASIGKRDITVNVNSPGGNFFSGLAIYNLLRAHPAKVTVNILAMAGSAASIIAMAGDEIVMDAGAQIMVHKASGVIVGNEYDARESAALLGQVDAAMAEIYAARTGKSQSEAAGWMDRERGKGTTFSRDEAIRNGLADKARAVPTVRVTASVAKSLPVEREMERAMMQAHGLSRTEAKARVAALKSGARDAAKPAMRDAGALAAALAAASLTIRS